MQPVLGCGDHDRIIACAGVNSRGAIGVNAVDIEGIAAAAEVNINRLIGAVGRGRLVCFWINHRVGKINVGVAQRRRPG